MVIWITGLAGSGKTTIGQAVSNLIQPLQPGTVFLDGEDVRAIMGNDLGFTVEDRRYNAWRICRLCQYLDGQGINVICATLSVFREQQEWNRQTYSNYFEIFVDVPMDELVFRDKKNLYSRALRKEISDVVGVDIPYTPPSNPHFVVKNGQPFRPPEIIAKEIIQALDSNFYTDRKENRA